MNIETALSAADEMSEEVISALRQLVARPSLAGSGEELLTTAEIVAEMAEASGFESSIWQTGGAPAVFARLQASPGFPTLLFYGHYDVQPPDPVDEWSSPPFVLTEREGALYGRGAGDNKGQFLAHIMAVRALQAQGGCPVGVKLLIEGEEEIGSPNLAATVRDHEADLACDLALTADGPLHDDGRSLIIFGVRGLLMLELRARGATHDVHSGNRGGWVPMPAWDLVEALTSLRDTEGKVAIPGFYDTVRPPTAAEQELMDSLPLDLESTREALGVTRLPDAAERAPWRTMMFEPTLNIPGFASGYTGTGLKTIVPNEAVARIEMRLVAAQDPDEIEASVRHHLRHFDLEINRLAAVPPSMTPLDCPHVEDVRSALRAASRREPLLRPRLGGTTPDHVFTQILGVPSLLVPYGSADMHHHAPNERIRVDDLHRGVRATAAICGQLARASH